MILRQTTPIFRQFPELAVNPERFHAALKEWTTSSAAVKSGISELRFFITEDANPILEFSVEIEAPTGNDAEVDIFFPVDDLLLYIGSKVLNVDDYQTLADKVLEMRRRGGPRVYQNYVFRVPGPGWEVGSAMQGGVFFGSLAVNLEGPFVYFYKREEGKTLVRLPFCRTRVVQAGVELAARPIVVALKAIEYTFPTAFFCQSLIHADDVSLIAESEFEPFQYVRCGTWMIELVNTAANPKPLRIRATNEWIATRPGVTALIMTGAITDERLTPGSKCKWTAEYDTNDSISGSGVITHGRVHASSAYTMIRVEG